MRKSYAVILGLIFSLQAFAQDDLLDLIPEEPIQDIVEATFKGTRLINMQTNEAPAGGVLQYVFQHRFGAMNNDFFYNFLGMDNAQVRLGLDYGITDRLSVGLGRSSYNKTNDFSLKYKILEQQTGLKNIPLSLTLFSSAYLNMRRRTDIDLNLPDRMTYAHQLIFARKFSQRFSMMISPSLVHFNLVEFREQNNTHVIIPAGMRIKINNRIALTAEYAPQLTRNFRQAPVSGDRENYINSFSIGVDIETGGHVFQLHLTNSRGLLDPEWMLQTNGDWLEGAIFFGFNISRVFTIREPKRPEVDN